MKEARRRKIAVCTIELAMLSGGLIIDDEGSIRRVGAGDASVTIFKELKLAYNRGFRAGRDGIK
jgi:hypothetical protein